MNRGPRWIAAFAGAFVTSALLCSLWAGGAAAAKNDPTPGSVEICKAPDNGAVGQAFSFALAGKTSQTVPVTGGQCSPAISVAAGNYTITEDLSSGLWNVASVAVLPNTAWLSETDKKGMVKVIVTAGQETQVTYTNAGAAATIKVCKWSASPSLQGSQYSFTIGSTTVTAIAGKSLAAAQCSGAVPTQPGTKLTISENTPNGEQVARADAGGNASITSVKGSVVKATAGVGANVVYFDNEPNAPAQTGYVEICKDAYDQFVNGSFHFELTSQSGVNLDTHPDGTTGEDILVGQCSGPIKVPVGNVVATESQVSGTQVQAIWTIDPNTLGLTNLVNGTATLVVPVSADTSNEVQVHFVNKTQTTILKICKYLPAGSEALAGQTYGFKVTDDAFPTGTVNPLSIVASAGQNGACKIVTDPSGRQVQFPIGSNAQAVETNKDAFISADGNSPGTDDTQTLTIGTGVNSIPFTNVALGQLEVCKNMIVGDSGLGQSFTFNYLSTTNSKAKGTVKVAAGACSLPQVVPAGNYTITEDLSKLTVNEPNGTKQAVFSFVASDARGPLGDNRCVPAQSTAQNQDTILGTFINTNCGNALTVSVPYFNSNDPTRFGETMVTVWNKQIRAQIKICKLVSSDSTATLGGMSFGFHYGINSNGGNTQNAGSLTPGTCTGTIGSFPVATGTGNSMAASTVDVQEDGLPNAVYAPSLIALTGGQMTASNLNSTAGGHIQFSPGPGVNVVTYTNTAKPAR